MAAINAVTLVVNLFHLVIITKIEALQSLPYRLILIHITVADIITAAYLLAIYSCVPMVFRIGRFQSFVFSFIEWPMLTSNWIFLASSIVQYLGICQPLHYNTSRFIEKLSSTLILSWVFTFAWVMMLTALTVITRGTPMSTAVRLLEFTCKYLPLILSGIILGMIVKELTKKDGSQLGQRQDQNRKASIYLIIIYSIAATFAFFDFVVSCINFIDPDLTSFLMQRLRNITRPVYGLLNTLIFCLRSKNYRQQVRDMLWRRN